MGVIPVADHQLPEELIELIAERFRAIGEPIRLRILEQLRNEPKTVQQLVGALGTTQQNVSKHLGVLRGLGIVNRRKEGLYAFYAIQDQSLLRVCDEVCGSLKAQIAELNHLIGEDLPA